MRSLHFGIVVGADPKLEVTAVVAVDVHHHGHDLPLSVPPDDGARGVFSSSFVGPRLLVPGVPADAAPPALHLVLILMEGTKEL